MKENKIWNDYLPEDMQEHWTVYECLKESEDSSTFLVKETATGILCVLKWGRNRQAEFLRNEMEIMEKMADRKLSGIPKTYRIFEENGEVYLVREYIEGMSLAQMVLQKGGISEAEICRISRKHMFQAIPAKLWIPPVPEILLWEAFYIRFVNPVSV